MLQYFKAAEVHNVSENKGLLVEIQGMEIAIFKRDGHLFAINNVCSHQHFSLLHRGVLVGCTVECPMHGWTYDLQTGKAIKGDGKVARYNVEVRDNNVFIELPEY